MAARLTNRVVSGCRAGWMPILLCALSAIAVAEDLPDPTRPPVEISPSISGRSVPIGQSVAPESSGLQSIIISQGRRSAIIYGHEVELGGKLGSATLVGVSESGVVLEAGRGRRGRRELPMFPGIEMKMRAPAPTVQQRNHVESANKASDNAEPKEQ